MYKTLEKGKRFCMNCITSLVGAKLGQRHAHRKNVKKATAAVDLLSAKTLKLTPS